MPQAAAANGWQQLVRRLTRQHKLELASRFFQCLEQAVGGDMVHALGRVNQHHFAAASGAAALAELDGLAQDFFAGLAFGTLQIGLRTLRQGPAKSQQHCLGHQNTQVGMGAHVQRVATLAVAAGAVGAGLITQPSRRQTQRQFILAQPGWPSQKPGMAALRQQLRGLSPDPGRRSGAQVSHPRWCTASRSACQTCSRGRLASILVKRAGSAACRWP